MFIDDNSKTVWCSKEAMRWYTSFYDAFGFNKRVAVYYVARVGFGYSLETEDNEKIDYKDWDPFNRNKLGLINALVNNYSFRLDREGVKLNE